MTIIIKYQSKYLDSAIKTDRYVRFDGSEFHFVEVNPEDRRFDVKQGTVTEDELPPEVAQRAKDRIGFIPSYVEWPHD